MTMYETLGVAPDASAKEVKTAYKRLAQEYHPDRPNGDREKFIPVQEAYDVLGNAKRRERYDRTGQTDYRNFDRMVDDKLTNLFNGMLTHPTDIVGDAIEQMKSMTRKGLSNTTNNQAEVQSKKFVILRRRDRIAAVENEVNLYRKLADQQVIQCSNEIERLGREIDVLNAVLDRLENYKDEAPVEQFTKAFYTTGTSTA